MTSLYQIPRTGPPDFQSNGRLRINPESPYKEDLALAWVGGSYGVDATGRNDFQTELTSAPSTADTVEGRVTRFADATDDALSFSEEAYFNPDKPFSIAFKMLWNSETGNQFLLLKSTDGNELQMIYSTDASYSDLSILTHNGSITVVALRSGTSFAPAGQWNSIVITFDGVNDSVASSWNFYCNGTKVTPSAAGATLDFTNENRWGRTEGSGRNFNGDWKGGRIWTGWEMPDVLAREMSLDYEAPGGIPIEYDPVQWPYLIVPTAAPPTGATGIEDIYYKTIAQGANF